MNKLLRSISATVLIVCLVVAGIPLQGVYAAAGDAAGSMDTTNKIQAQENKDISDKAESEGNKDISDKAEPEGSGDKTEPGKNGEVQEAKESYEALEKEKGEIATNALLNYIVVENPYLSAPATQNIIAEFGDESTAIQGAVLSYKNCRSGEEFHTDAQNINGNAVRFSIAHQETEEEEYQLISITYKTDEQEVTIILQEIGMDIRYGVNAEIEAQPNDVIVDEEMLKNTEDDLPLDIVATDVEGNILSENNIQDILAKQNGKSVQSQNENGEQAAVRASGSGELVVMLDPGHDDSHAGTQVNNYSEEDLVLKIAQYCKAELEQYMDVTVYMTRYSGACPNGGKGDAAQCNAQRVDQAAARKADIYVSFHLNYNENPSAHGAGVYYPNSNYNAEIGQQGHDLAERVIAKLTALGLSKWAGGILIRNSEDNTLYPDGTLADYLGIIRRCKLKNIPAILIEHAFQSNKDEVNQFLSTDEKLQKLGIADAEAIAEYYGLSKEASVSIPEGTYVIKSAVNGNKVVDIAGAAFADGAAAQIYDGNNSAAQRFEFVKLSNGYYKIVSENSGKVLTVSNDSYQAGAKLQQEVWKDKVGQMWKLYDAGNGSYYMKSRLGMYIDLTNYSTQNGNQLQLYTLNGSDAQKWVLQKMEYRPLEDGTYEIRSALNKNKVVDIANGSVGNGANVQLYARNGSSAQRFEITYMGNGYYRIVSELSGKVLDIYGGNENPGANVQQYAYNGSDAQLWKFVETSNGTYFLRSKTGNVLDISGGTAKDGANILVQSCTGGSAQQWDIQKIDYRTIADGVYLISSKSDAGKVIDIAAGSSSNGANVHINGQTNSGTQRFRVSYVGNGYYKIIGEKTGKALDVYAGSTSAGANVQQYSYNGSDAQLWKFIDSGDGYYYIRSKTGNVLDVYAGSTANGSNVQVYSLNRSNAQKWQLKTLLAGESVQPFSDGTYAIANLNDGRVMDVYAGSMANEANVQTWTSNDSSAQRYELTYIQDGYYKISVEGSGKVLDVKNLSSANGANLQQSEWNGSAAQLWEFRKDSNGNYNIYSKLGTCIDVYAGLKEDGANIQMYAYNGSNAQKWKITQTEYRPVADGEYFFRSIIDSRKVIDIAAANTGNFANAQLYTVNNSDAQRFKVTYIGNGYYKIVAKHSNRALDIYAGSSSNNANVNQYSWNGSAAQQWKFVSTGNGRYYIKSRLGTCIDLPGAATGNGTNIQTYTMNGSLAQQWLVEGELTNIMGDSSVGYQQLMRYYQKYAGISYPSAYASSDAKNLETFCRMYVEECAAEGVRAEVAFSQAMKETGYLKFTGDVSITQYNFAGIGATGNGEPGNRFSSVREGIRAQVQHLKAYASKEALKNPCVDPRFHYVKRGSAVYVEWLGIKENPSGGGWATAKNYGYSIKKDYMSKLFAS